MKKYLIILVALCVVAASIVGTVHVKTMLPQGSNDFESEVLYVSETWGMEKGTTEAGTLAEVKETMAEEIGNHGSETEAAKDNAPEDETAKNNAPEDEAAKDNAPEDETAKDNAPEDEAAKDNAPETDVARDHVSENEEIENAESGQEEVKAEQGTEEPQPSKPQSALETVTKQIGLRVDEVAIDLPGVEKAYEILFVSDMHILTVDESVYEDHVSVAQNRYENMFRSSTGTYSYDTWQKLSSVIDDFQADALVMGGDMMDFVSPANVTLFQNGLNQIKTPYMYLRADHDMGTWYSDSLSTEDALGLHRGICSYEDMYIMDFGEFYVLGWNNSTGQLTEAGLVAAQGIWDNGKPIILATHVPINSIIDNGLAEMAAGIDPQGRVKLWGYDCLYQPAEDATAIFLEMLYDAQSPVKAVLSGHLHFKYTVPLTEQLMEYVFAPSYAGNIAKIRVY